MLRYSRGKIAAILLLAFAGFYFAAPSLMSPETRAAIRANAPGFIPAWLIPSQAIVLGLDLQGGSHVLLEVDSGAVVKTQINSLRDDMRRVLRDEKVALAGGIAVLPRGVTVRIADANERARVLPKLRELASSGPAVNLIRGAAPSLIEFSEQPDGLITLTVTDEGVNEKIRKAIDQAIEAWIKTFKGRHRHHSSAP